MSLSFRTTFVVAMAGFLVACGSAEDTRPRVVQLYDQSCISCHERGLANAPRRGDERWQLLLDEKGMETLVKHAREGFRGMPPRGQCFDCSDQDYAALIRYMAGEPAQAIMSETQAPSPDQAQ